MTHHLLVSNIFPDSLCFRTFIAPLVSKIIIRDLCFEILTKTLLKSGTDDGVLWLNLTLPLLRGGPMGRLC